jgi:hypothetical protein
VAQAAVADVRARQVGDAAPSGRGGHHGRDGTRLADGIVTTDNDGRAVTSLLIGNEPAKALLVVTASIGPFSAQATISAEVLG